MLLKNTFCFHSKRGHLVTNQNQRQVFEFSQTSVLIFPIFDEVLFVNNQQETTIWFYRVLTTFFSHTHAFTLTTWAANAVEKWKWIDKVINWSKLCVSITISDKILIWDTLEWLRTLTVKTTYHDRSFPLSPLSMLLCHQKTPWWILIVLLNNIEYREGEGEYFCDPASVSIQENWRNTCTCA